MSESGLAKIGVIGIGTMGNGIAQVFAQCGNDVNLIDVKQEFLDRAMGTIEKNLGRMVKKEKISEEDAKATLGRLRTLSSANPSEASTPRSAAVSTLPDRNAAW